MFPDPSCTDDSDGFEVFDKSDEIFNQIVASRADSRRRGR